MPPNTTPPPTIPTPPPVGGASPLPPTNTSVASLSSPPSLTSQPVPNTTEPPPPPTQPVNNSSDSDEDAPKPLWRRILSFFVSWIVIPGLLVFIVHNFVFQAWYVEGESMQPSFQNGDYLIVSKLDTSWRKLTNSSNKLGLQRGQVVIFQPPNYNAEVYYIKRVIGLPGDRVVIKDGKITIYNNSNISGFVLDEPYTGGVELEGDIDKTIEPGEVFVIGDNRNHDASQDSRAIGPIPMKQIVGIASLRLLPTSQFGTIAEPKYEAKITNTPVASPL